MLPRLHVGLTVWPARSDFFFAVRRWVSQHPNEEAFEALSLSAEQLRLVTKVEYSSRWLFRVVYYRKIAKFLEAEIRRVMREAEGRYSEVILYTPDDGYWAELLHTIRGRVGGPLRILNLQHGHATAALTRRPLRRLLNRISVSLFGYPNFGYGFGAGSLDGYVVMSAREADFIAAHFHTPAYILPGFLRGDFLDGASAEAAPVPERPRILFAISPIFARKSNLLNARHKAETQFLHDIAAMLTEVAAAVPCDIFFRFHPGTDANEARRKFHEVGLDRVATIDAYFGIADSLKACDFAVAYNSTVLMEAALLGKVPINFIPLAYPPYYDLGIKAEVLNLARAENGAVKLVTARGSLANLFSKDVMRDYRSKLQEMDYSVSLPWL